jgi:hypothetical protein
MLKILFIFVIITTLNTNDTANLNANYKAKNNRNKKFWLNLSRTLDINARIGIAT